MCSPQPGMRVAEGVALERLGARGARLVGRGEQMEPPRRGGVPRARPGRTIGLRRDVMLAA